MLTGHWESTEYTALTHIGVRLRPNNVCFSASLIIKPYYLFVFAQLPSMSSYIDREVKRLEYIDKRQDFHIQSKRKLDAEEAQKKVFEIISLHNSALALLTLSLI